MHRTAAPADQTALGRTGGGHKDARMWPVRGWSSAYFRQNLLNAVRYGEREWAHAFLATEESEETDLINLFGDAPIRPQILGPVACRTLHAASRIADFSAVDHVFSILNRMQETAFEPWCYVTKSVDRKAVDRISSARAKTFGPVTRSPQIPAREKPRIAYLSMDFVSHSAGVPLAPLIKAHDKERFDVLVFDMSLDSRFKDELGAISIGHLDIRTARARIYDARPDMLIDTTANLRDGCEWLGRGFCGSLIHAWGYDAANRGVEPDLVFGDAAMKVGGRSSMVLNRYLPFAFQPTRKVKKTGGQLVFGALGPTYKISRTLFRIWMRVLASVPNAVLYLAEGGRKNMRKEAEQCGIDPDRLVFLSRASRAAHLKRLSRIDIALDNSRLGGSHFILDALAAGIPAICYPGRRFSDRSGLSIARSLGLPDELVANTLDDYAVKAALLAGSSDLYRRMCEAVAGLSDLSVCGVARDIERLVKSNLR